MSKEKDLSTSKISENQMDKISGGHLFNSQIQPGVYIESPVNPWEVLNKRGNVVYRAPDEETAKKWAINNGYFINEISREKLIELRRWIKDQNLQETNLN